MKFIVAFAALLTIVSTTAQARVHHHRHHVAHYRVHHVRVANVNPTGCFTIDDRYPCAGSARGGHVSRTRTEYASYDDGQIVGHPSGCPRSAFCGCGVSVKVFGHPVRELYLASNYGYYFNESAFASGNVAYRSHHAVYIMGGTRSAALIYDPNSGGHQTRVHYRDLSGYRVVDPHSPKRHLAGA